MKNVNITLLFLLVLFSSCYTVKTMNRQVTKGYVTYPVEFKDLVIKLVPVETKDSVNTTIEYIPGDTITKTIYTKADCDTIKPDASGKKIVYLEGKYRIVHDTIYKDRTHYKTVKDTREIDVLTSKYNNANIIIAKRENTINILKWTLISLGALIAGYILIFKVSIFSKIKNLF